MIRGFLGGASGKEPAYQCRRPGFDPEVGKIPGRRARQSALIFLPEETSRTESLVGYSPWGCRELDMTEVTELACMYLII